MNKIVIELCAQDRARLDAIISGLEKIGSPARAVLDVADAPAPIPDPVDEAPAPAAPAPVEEAPAPVPEMKPVSLGEFQKVIATLCARSEEVKEKVRTVVLQYAGSVSEVPEDKRPEVLAALSQL